MLAPMPDDQTQHVRRMVPRHLVSDVRFTDSVRELDEEIEEDYYFSLRKGIGKLTRTCCVVVVSRCRRRHRCCSCVAQNSLESV